MKASSRSMLRAIIERQRALITSTTAAMNAASGKNLKAWRIARQRVKLLRQHDRCFRGWLKDDIEPDETLVQAFRADLRRLDETIKPEEEAKE